MKVALIILAVTVALSWAVTVGIIKLVCLCFGLPFSLLAATGVWLVMMLARGVFRGGGGDK